jgi:hypothetical protein
MQVILRKREEKRKIRSPKSDIGKIGTNGVGAEIHQSISLGHASIQ